MTNLRELGLELVEDVRELIALWSNQQRKRISSFGAEWPLGGGSAGYRFMREPPLFFSLAFRDSWYLAAFRHNLREVLSLLVWEIPLWSCGTLEWQSGGSGGG